MFQLRSNDPLTVTLRGIVNRFRRPDPRLALGAGDRLDGKTCLITGANSGLGKATAIALAERGAHVIMACRGGIPEAGDDVRAASGSSAVEMMRVDLSDLASIHALCDALVERDIALDRVVCNAGVMPRASRKTAQGFELMFGVNYLANAVLLGRLLGDRRLRDQGGDDPARIVIVSSETHRTARAIDFDHFGDYVEYGMVRGLGEYAYSKLLLTTFALELARRARDAGGRAIAVHALCPGPVASNITRDAPAWLKPILEPMLRLCFRSPAAAAAPVVYLTCSPAIAGETGKYLHAMREASPSPAAADPAIGARLWAASEALLAGVEEAGRARN